MYGSSMPDDLQGMNKKKKKKKKCHNTQRTQFTDEQTNPKIKKKVTETHPVLWIVYLMMDNKLRTIASMCPDTPDERANIWVNQFCSQFLTI